MFLLNGTYGLYGTYLNYLNQNKVEMSRENIIVVWIILYYCCDPMSTFAKCTLRYTNDLAWLYLLQKRSDPGEYRITHRFIWIQAVWDQLDLYTVNHQITPFFSILVRRKYEYNELGYNETSAIAFSFRLYTNVYQSIVKLNLSSNLYTSVFDYYLFKMSCFLWSLDTGYICIFFTRTL